MNEDGDETQPTGASRPTLAASTLRALRAGRGGNASGAPADPSDPPADLPDPSADPPDPPADPSDGDQLADPVVSRPDRLVDHPEKVGQETVGQEEVGQDAVDGVAIVPHPLDGPAATRSRRGGLLTGACAVLAVAALVFAVIAGVSWWTAGHSEQRRLGLARSQVKKDAELAIATVNTSDYRQPSAALSNWLEASTGSLHSEFSQSRGQAVKLLGEAKTVTKATVLAAAVTSVDLAKGNANVIASVNVVRTHDGSNSTVRNRFRATMTRVGGQWKLSNLAVVPVSLS